MNLACGDSFRVDNGFNFYNSLKTGFRGGFILGATKHEVFPNQAQGKNVSLASTIYDDGNLIREDKEAVDSMPGYYSIGEGDTPLVTGSALGLSPKDSSYQVWFRPGRSYSLSVRFDFSSDTALVDTYKGEYTIDVKKLLGSALLAYWNVDVHPYSRRVIWVFWGTLLEFSSLDLPKISLHWTLKHTSHPDSQYDGFEQRFFYSLRGLEVTVSTVEKPLSSEEQQVTLASLDARMSLLAQAVDSLSSPFSSFSGLAGNSMIDEV